MAAAILLLVLLAQVPQPPARDRSGGPPALAAGTASIAGVVMTEGESPQPLRHASVTLSMGALGVPRIAVSDEAGRFLFTDLPQGSYHLSATRPAWVPVDGGLRTAYGTGGVPVNVREGDAITGLTVRMARGAVLAGVVRHPGGVPASGVLIQALRAVPMDGRRLTSVVAPPVTTGADGEYRIYGLPAGSYVVQASTTLMGQDVEVRPVLPSDVRWAEALAQQARQAPAGVLAVPAPPEAPPTQRVAATFYPGTARVSDALVVTVAAGEERPSLDFEIVHVPTAVISGRVIGLDGAPARQAMVSLQNTAVGPEDDLLGFAAQLAGQRGVTQADGAFALRGVAPGQYRVTVRAAPPPSPGQRGQALMGVGALFGGAGAMAGAMPLWAEETVEVSGRPVGPLTLQLREGLTVSGRLVFETGVPPAAGAIRVSLADPSTDVMAPGMAMLMQMGQFSGAAVAADAEGGFTIGGLTPGRYTLGVTMPGMRASATAPGTGWMVTSVQAAGRDLTDFGVEVAAGADLSALVVTLTDAPAELSGRVLDAASQPFAAYPLVVFPADRSFWVRGSRRVHLVQPAADGSYVVAGLPGGEYLLALVTEVDRRELASPAFLESLVPSALRLTLTDGERRTQNVRLSGAY